MDPRADLVRHYRWLRRYGLNDSHSGNASVREGETIWVTPTGACADTLEPDALVRCDIDGTVGPGASLDAPLHVRVYQRNPEARAVLHAHGPYSIVTTLHAETFEPIDFEGRYYFERVPVVAIPAAEYLRRAPDEVARLLADHRVAVVQGHGVFAQGESINLAYKWLCSLESSARLAWLDAQGRR